MSKNRKQYTTVKCYNPEQHPVGCSCAVNTRHGRRTERQDINGSTVQTGLRAYTPPDDQSTGLAEEYDTQE